MSWDIFEDYAEEYDLWFDEHQSVYHAELARIRKLCPQTNSRSIEIGTGSGRFAKPLGISIGLEPSAALSRTACHRGIEVVRGEAEAIPFGDGSFSSALMVTVVCFLDDPWSALMEIHTILAPGGSLTIAFIERDEKVAKKYLNEPGKHRILLPCQLLLFRRCGEARGSRIRVDVIDSCAGFLCGRFARRPERMIGLQAKSSPGKPGNPPVAGLGQNPKNNSDSLEKRGKTRSFFLVRCSSFISQKNQ